MRKSNPIDGKSFRFNARDMMNQQTCKFLGYYWFLFGALNMSNNLVCEKLEKDFAKKC